MAARKQPATAEREIVATRVFDAPRELVFKMFTDRYHIAQWWGPQGFTNTIHEMDVRPGGLWDFIMHGPDGTDYKNKNVYSEVTPQQRIAYSHVTGPKHDVIVTFEKDGNKTRLTMRMIFETPEERESTIKTFGAVEGLNQTLGRLEDRLTKLARHNITVVARQPIVVMERVFDAPRPLVFEATTRAEHIKNWWGPRRYTLTVCEVDLRPGGAYRFVQRGPDGRDYPFKGVYREIVPPERVVFTEIFDLEPFSNYESINTVTYLEEDGKTRMTCTSVYSSLDHRDGYLNGGMEGGAMESWDRLADHLASLLVANRG